MRSTHVARMLPENLLVVCSCAHMLIRDIAMELGNGGQGGNLA